MKKFKTADCIISAGLITGFIIAGFMGQYQAIFTGYFVVGAWQLLSMGVHAYKGWFTRKGGARKGYHITVAFILIIALLGTLVEILLSVLAVGLLFLAPLMAVYYTWICYREVFVKLKRPMAFGK